MKYSVWQLIKQSLKGHINWDRIWKESLPKKEYDIIIVGGGGHGLATAYYLAKDHKIKNIAVIEKNWIGLGNVGRNTTIIRSNYMHPVNTYFYEKSMQLWENLEQELNYNTMVSQRGVFNLYHNDSQRDTFARRGNTMRMAGVDAELIEAPKLRKTIPILNFDNTRFPIEGALLQKRGGTVRHDAVAWGYARAASNLGVDIIQNCEVTGFEIESKVIKGVKTNLGNIKAKKVGLAVAGQTSLLTKKAGLKIPIESHILQAFVSEAIKPLIDNVITFGAGHFYISQSDKGGLVFGGDLDGYNSYAQKGNLPTMTNVMSCGMSILPSIGRVKLLRQWGGIMDMSFDGSPFICKTPIAQLYLNAGWCYGGFKATPASGWCFAHTITKDQPHELNSSYTIDRFKKGKLIDEKGVGPKPWLQ